MIQVVKLGGSVIAAEEDGSPRARTEVIERLAEELATAGDELVVVHGAGSFGHPLAAEHGFAEGLEATAEARDGLAALHAQVRELDLEVLEGLREAGLPAMSLSPFGSLSCNDGQPGGWNLVPVHRMLERGLVPVSYGDVVLDTSRGITVLSGDRIVAEIARFLQADQLVFALDQDGVYSHPPGASEAELLEAPGPEALEAARERAGGGEGPDVTGGMAGKIGCAVDAVRSGTTVSLVNGLKAGRVQEALGGKTTGTVLEPRRDQHG